MKFVKIQYNKNSGRIAFLIFIFSAVIFNMFIFTIPVFAAQGAPSGKTGNISVIYGIASVISLMLVAGYLFLIKKKDFWFLILFLCVFVVNSGYLLLSVAHTLEGALLANKISYLSAFLPLIMLVIIMDVCQIQYPRLLLAVLSCVSLSAFLLAASGRSFGLYYREVSLGVVDGGTKLFKVYGPLHFLYSIYLFVYFGAMVAALVYSFTHKKMANHKQAVILVSVVLGNIFVWFMEQMVEIDFEFLSVSYIITEIFLLLLYNMMQDYDILAPGPGGEVRRDYDIQDSGPEEVCQDEEAEVSCQDDVYALPPDVAELFDTFSQRAVSLTPAERKILKYYAEGREISEVAELAFISIHTVRKHNANIYQKLGVGSRDELMLYLELFRRCGRLEELL